MFDWEKEHKQLIEELLGEGLLRNERIRKAFEELPRHLFVPESVKRYAFENRPLPIGYGQTISQPSIVAQMTELLDPKPGDKVLEIGAGSGWQAAILAKIIYPGKVYTVERIKELAEFAKKNLERAGIKNVEVIVGDGTLGYKKEAPYDKIIVTAAAPEIPAPLIEQLKVNGRMIIPVGSAYMQELLLVIKKDEKNFEIQRHGACVFVKLIGKYGWNE